ncbi:MAG: hypothetical protein AAGI51_01235 [Pseudomonadota bacterium]
MPRRRLILGALLFGTPVLAAAASGMLIRFHLTEAGGAAAALLVLALLAAALAGERLAGDAPGGPLARLRGGALPWLMLAFVLNGGVRTWTLAADLPLEAVAVSVANTIAVGLSAALAALLIGPTLERLAAALRAERGAAAAAGAGADAASKSALARCLGARCDLALGMLTQGGSDAARGPRP